MIAVWANVVLAAAIVDPPCITVSFPTEDEGLVYADVYGEGERGVVLAHGGRFDRTSWETQARILAGSGFRVVAIDFRGRGLSRAGRAGEDGVPLDVLAAVRYLQKTGAKTIALVGASFGGGAAAQVSTEARAGEIDRLVLLAHSAIGAPERMQGRKLFIVAREDANDAGLRLPRIRAQYERASEPKELVILEGAAHAQFLFATSEGKRLTDEILRFLSVP